MTISFHPNTNATEIVIFCDQFREAHFETGVFVNRCCDNNRDRLLNFASSGNPGGRMRAIRLRASRLAHFIVGDDTCVIWSSSLHSRVCVNPHYCQLQPSWFGLNEDNQTRSNQQNISIRCVTRVLFHVFRDKLGHDGHLVKRCNGEGLQRVSHSYPRTLSSESWLFRWDPWLIRCDSLVVRVKPNRHFWVQFELALGVPQGSCGVIHTWGLPQENHTLRTKGLTLGALTENFTETEKHAQDTHEHSQLWPGSAR